ncbi:CRPV-077 [Crowpox virus]|nr:CRPV-077 [Crowpox virus]
MKMNIFEYLCDSSYTIIAVISLLVILENIEQGDFFDYVENSITFMIPKYYTRMFLYIISYGFMGHGMYIISTENYDSAKVIFTHLLQLSVGLSWFIVFYNMNILRLSMLISSVHLFLSLYNSYVWYSIGPYISLFNVPCISMSVINLLLNFRTIQTYHLTKDE